MPMAPEKHKAVATLDSEELSFVRRLFKNGGLVGQTKSAGTLPDVKSDGRISVAEVVACVEQMDFIVDEPLEDLVRSVVPAAIEVDRLSLNDAIKVASAAKAQDKGSEAPKVPTVGRDDSLAELESSFIKQVMSGEIAADVIEEEPRAPSQGLGREDSLAQLESSFKKQVLSGNIPAAIMEAPEDSTSVPPPNIVAVSVDVPKRRQSVAGGYPAPPSSPRNTPRGQVKRGGSLSAMAGPEPVVVDDLPKRRSSVTRPGGGSLAGLQAESVPGSGIYDDDVSTMPATPEMKKQSSEMQLLESVGSLSVEPVEASSVPKKRRSFTVSQSWLDAAAQESAKALEAKKHGEAQQAEAERQKAESEKTRAEVAACLFRLTDQVEHNAEIERAKEEAEKRERAAALEVERAEAAAARTEVETAMRLLVESLERDAAVAKAKEEAERLVQREAEARQAAEMKAAEAAERAEEAARARQEEDRIKEEARRALQAEAELLRSKLQEAGEEAAERAQEEAQARAHKEARELKQAEEQAEREAKLVEEAKRAAEREAEIKEAADQDAKSWEEKFQALQREREEEAQRAKEELARAVEEAKEFERAKESALRAAEERHPLQGANVSYDDVNSREGKNWWQCLSCIPEESSDTNVDGRGASSKSMYDNEDDAAVSGLKPEMWVKSAGATASTRSMDRPGKVDVCSIS